MKSHPQMKTTLRGLLAPFVLSVACLAHPAAASERVSLRSLLAQPDGNGNLQPGASVNIRHRVLDAIPFGTSLVFDMELWHWRECVVDYDAFCWYYVKPTPAGRTTVLAADRQP